MDGSDGMDSANVAAAPDVHEQRLLALQRNAQVVEASEGV